MEQQTQQSQQNETNTPSDFQPKEFLTPNKSFYVAGGLGVAVLVILGIFVLIQSNGDERNGVGKGKDECRITGCSSQICSDQEVITTCEALPEHVCYRNAVCERQSNGSCGWTQTSELTQCLEAKSAKQTLIDTAGWQTYRNDEFGFEVKYPENWKLGEDNGPVLRGSHVYENIYIRSVPIKTGQEMLDVVIANTTMGECGPPNCRHPAEDETFTRNFNGNSFFYVVDNLFEGQYSIVYYVKNPDNNTAIKLRGTGPSLLENWPLRGDHDDDDEPDHSILKQILSTFRFVKKDSIDK